MTITLYLMSFALVLLGLQLQLAYPQNLSQSQNETEILCQELAKINEMLPPDTEVLPETAVGQSFSQRECGFNPNVDPGALAEAQEALNQSSNS
jgi:hypothetical protein